MKAKRILIFSLAYFPNFVGGAEVAVKEITDRIGEDEAVFDMITFGNNRSLPALPEKIGNINIYRVNARLNDSDIRRNKISLFTKLLYILAANKKAKELLAANNYDLIWAIMASYAGLAATIFKRNHPNIPFLLTVQEGDHFERKMGLLSFVFRQVFKSAEKIQVISSYLADWAREMGTKGPISIVPNGVNYEHFSQAIAASDLKSAEEKIGKNPGDIFLVTTSRLVTKNAVGDIIQSLKFLPENIKLLVIGIGDEEQVLKQSAKDLSVQQRVIFLGFVNQKTIPIYLKACDIFVRPSLSEGFGNSFIEAMAAGIPVIATPVGGITDFLVDKKTGLLCDVSNPEDIAVKIKEMISNPELKNSLIKNAYEMVKEKYTWEKVVLGMKKVLLG